MSKEKYIETELEIIAFSIDSDIHTIIDSSLELPFIPDETHA